MRLSVLDQSPISEGSTGADALANTIDLARHCEALGYHRYWLAEHHGGPMLAGPSPEALIPAVAGATSTMRIGSGGVMLPHYSRVQGRGDVLAPLRPVPGPHRPRHRPRGGHRSDDDLRAAARPPHRPAPDDFPEQLAELLAHYDGGFPDNHPFARLGKSLPGAPHQPEIWLLGSSAQSAIWAGQLGLPYALADFINPEGAANAELYRERFEPSARTSSQRTAVAVWAICADTDEEAERLAASGRMTFTLLRQGRLIAVPPPEKAQRFIASTEGVARRGVIGSPETVRAGIETIASAYGAEEVIVVTITYDHGARRRSYELIADAFGVEPPAEAAVHAG